MFKRVGLFGNYVELFGERDDFFKLVDGIDTLGDCVGVGFTSRVEGVFDALTRGLASFPVVLCSI